MTYVATVIALASLVVAVGAYFINRKAINDEWAREWAAQRPVIYPLALQEWTSPLDGAPYFGSNARLLPLKNGGRGPALEVHGVVECRSQTEGLWYRREILAATIAPGDLFNARLSPDVQHWIGSKGIIRYRDLAGLWYETAFEGTAGPRGEIDLHVDEPRALGPGRNLGRDHAQLNPLLGDPYPPHDGEPQSAATIRLRTKLAGYRSGKADQPPK